jgi:hypothetical protein
MIRKIARELAFLLFVVSVPGVIAQDKAPTEAYSGMAIGTGGSVGGKTAQFDFRVTKYTTNEEVQNFAQLLRDNSTDAIRKALEKATNIRPWK